MRNKIVVLLVFAVSLMLFGCGGGGGGGSSVGEIKVKTTIDMDDGSSMAGEKSAGKAAVNMAVTLTLPDGTTVVMERTGNGNEYECYINYTEGDPVYIKAVYGDVVLKNFIESIDVSSSDVTLDNVTPTTTLFVDVLEGMVEALGAVGSEGMVAHLLEGVKNATLAIDVTTVKEEVSDTNNPVYSVLRETYSAALTWAGVADGTVASDTLYSSVEELIDAGGITIPASEDDAAAIEAAAVNIMNKLFSGEYMTVAGLIDAVNFLNGGYDSTEFINEVTDEFSGYSSATINIISNTAKATKVTSGDPAYALISFGEMYRIHNAVHYQFLSGGTVIAEEAYDDAKSGYPGFVFQKQGSSWFGLGDRYKAEYDMILTTDENMPKRKIHAEVCEGSTAIDTVVVTSTGYTGSVSLTRSPYDTECYTAEIYEDGQVWGWDSVTGWDTLPSVTIPANGTFCGKTVVATVNYDDSSVETRTIILPPCVNKTVTSSIAKNGSGDVVITYSVPNEADRSEVRIEGSIVFPGGYEEMVFEKEYLPFSGGTAVFDADLFSSGDTYRFRVHYTDLYNRLYIDRLLDITY